MEPVIYRCRETLLANLLSGMALLAVYVWVFSLNDPAFRPYLLISFAWIWGWARFLRFEVRLRHRSLVAAFVPGGPRTIVPLGNLVACQVVTRPVPFWRGSRVRKNTWYVGIPRKRVLELTTLGGHRYFIGVRDPEALLRAVQEAVTDAEIWENNLIEAKITG